MSSFYYMVHDEVINFIREQRQAGVSDVNIRQALSEVGGWDEGEVSEAYTAVEREVTTPDSLPTQDVSATSPASPAPLGGLPGMKPVVATQASSYGDDHIELDGDDMLPPEGVVSLDRDAGRQPQMVSGLDRTAPIGSLKLDIADSLKALHVESEPTTSPTSNSVSPLPPPGATNTFSGTGAGLPVAGDQFSAGMVRPVAHSPAHDMSRPTNQTASGAIDIDEIMNGTAPAENSSVGEGQPPQGAPVQGPSDTYSASAPIVTSVDPALQEAAAAFAQPPAVEQAPVNSPTKPPVVLDMAATIASLGSRRPSVVSGGVAHQAPVSVGSDIGVAERQPLHVEMVPTAPSVEPSSVLPVIEPLSSQSDGSVLHTQEGVPETVAQQTYQAPVRSTEEVVSSTMTPPGQRYAPHAQPAPMIQSMPTAGSPAVDQVPVQTAATTESPYMQETKIAYGRPTTPSLGVQTVGGAVVQGQGVSSPITDTRHFDRGGVIQSSYSTKKKPKKGLLWLILILLVLGGGFFAWNQGYLDTILPVQDIDQNTGGADATSVLASVIEAFRDQESTSIAMSSKLTISGPLVDPRGLFVGGDDSSLVQNLEVYVDGSALNASSLDAGSYSQTQYTIDGDAINIGYQMKTTEGVSYFLMDRTSSDLSSIGIAKSLENVWLYADTTTVAGIGAGLFTNIGVLKDFERTLLTEIWSRPELIMQFDKLEGVSTGAMTPTTIKGELVTGEQSLSSYSLILDMQNTSNFLASVGGAVGTMLGSEVEMGDFLNANTRIIIDPIIVAIGDLDHLPYSFETKIVLIPEGGEEVSLRINSSTSTYGAGIEVLAPTNLEALPLDRFVNELVLGIQDDVEEVDGGLEDPRLSSIGEGEDAAMQDSGVPTLIKEIMYGVDISPLLMREHVSQMVSEESLEDVSAESLLARIRILAAATRDPVTGNFDNSICDQENGYLADLYTSIQKEIGGKKANCSMDTSSDTWVVWAAISEESYYCVDSAGFAGGIASPSPNEYYCPVAIAN
ncbi:MAG: hypothetical protein ACI83D_000625 [Planctomycetota bacterium]